MVARADGDAVGSSIAPISSEAIGGLSMTNEQTPALCFAVPMIRRPGIAASLLVRDRWPSASS